ncbi:MAG: hypothetical protein D8M57_13390 [Candidatus Scalindua sp. AMX11]|nr:MAG: hypothetical protein DWQ00_04830 [Candidatus Scalindua sp.]NOG83508.1 hypothetical protein [Planctomycetota bacterium]RZV72086.1 MAG: hypothetical protein EX341_14485 [Candidatus Scalindua sp. SCAELEC01]TDE64363.1 MAG: hypothetical protein D8M57_13390 [Candidatus Scalindua sp. AMX11]GJQ59890.1 MAG: hypothetical protein SCALA701_26910 [Candidatus Scalindua sp.]
MSIPSIITLYVIGLVAITIELFIPGAIVGLCGAACVIASITLAYIHISNLVGHTLLGLGICFIPIFFVSWYKILSKTFSIKASEEGFTSAEDRTEELLSSEGVAVTTLRPSGTANISGNRVDVISEGEMIAKNTRVKVIEVKGNRIVVKPVKL